MDCLYDANHANYNSAYHNATTLDAAARSKIIATATRVRRDKDDPDITVLVAGNGVNVARVHMPADVRVTPLGVVNGSITVTAVGPYGTKAHCTLVKQKPGHYHGAYTPTIVGSWLVSIRIDGKAVPGKKFTCNVYDPRKVKVFDTQPGILGRLCTFGVNTREAGEGDLSVVVISPKGRIASRVRNEGLGKYRVSFSPEVVGMHKVFVNYNGDEIAESPFQIEVGNTSAISAHGKGLQRCRAGSRSTFKIKGCSGGDIKVTITGPSGATVPNITNVSGGNYVCEFTPFEAGDHEVDVQYNGESIEGCPTTIQVYDPRAVVIHGVDDGVVGQQCLFQVDVSQAGAGDVQIKILNHGRPVKWKLSSIEPNKLNVSFIPERAGPHDVTVTFEGDTVPGCPFRCNVIDPSRVAPIKHQPRVATAGRLTNFTVTTRDAGEGTTTFIITDPFGSVIPCRVENERHEVRAHWTPSDVGRHHVQVLFGGVEVPGSPYVVQSYDSSKISVEDLETTGRPGEMVEFTVNTEGAGEGDLKCHVTTEGGTSHVKSTVRKIAAERYAVTFRPESVGEHDVRVTYNGVDIPGTPFACNILNPDRVSVTGDGRKRVQLNSPYRFFVHTQGGGKGTVQCAVTGPGHVPVPCKLEDKHGGDFIGEFVPDAIGEYQIKVLFEGNEVSGSPFGITAYDVERINVRSTTYQAKLGQPARMQVDTGTAGDGSLQARVEAENTDVPCSVEKDDVSHYTIAFTPKIAVKHFIFVKFNETPLKGSPFKIDVSDPTSVAVSGAGLGIVPVGHVTNFTVDTARAGLGRGGVDVKISNDQGQLVPCDVTEEKQGLYKCSYTPHRSGSHRIEVSYDGSEAVGSPYISEAFDVTKVHLVNRHRLVVGKEATVEVDASRAGRGNIDVNVTTTGRRVPSSVARSPSQTGIYSVTFFPEIQGPHDIQVLFNGIPVQGSPFRVNVLDPGKVTAFGSGIQSVPINRQAHFTVDPNGEHRGTVTATINAPSGRRVPCTIAPTYDGTYAIQYLPTEVGQHRIDVNFSDHPISGSPFYCNVYDVSKVTVSKLPGVGYEGREIRFQVDTGHAGMGTVDVEVTCEGNRIPHYMSSREAPRLYNVGFMPEDVGVHKITITFNQEPVPGSPFFVDVRDSGHPRAPPRRSRTFSLGEKHNDARAMVVKPVVSKPIVETVDVGVGSLNIRTLQAQVITEEEFTKLKKIIVGAKGGKAKATANGEGLYRCFQNTPAQFIVETTDGKSDRLDVKINGPNTIAKHKIQQDGSRFYVSFTPVEVGIFDIYVGYDGTEIDGSPFHPVVVNPSKVQLLGELRRLLDKKGRILLFIRETCFILLDTAEAGPGKVKASVQGPSRQTPVQVGQENGGKQRISFVPEEEGKHLIEILFSDAHIPSSPIYGLAKKRTSALPVDHTKVVVWGEGLRKAQVARTSEFTLDGSQAGKGTPSCILNGLKADVPVKIEEIRDRKNTYRATYKPDIPGSYLLNITWSGKKINGAPFKVSVTKPIDSAKVVFSGLKWGFGGQALRATVDIRKAGRGGKLAARCLGPSKPARVDLTDNFNGTFLLCLHPVEKGKHKLEIKYDGSYIPGSPFIVNIVGYPDPAKVKAFGPGLSNGVLGRFMGEFVCETVEAGPGQLKVRVHGPKGAFNVQMTPTGPKGRTVIVRYDPTEPGEYEIDVKWSEIHVPGSPFRIILVDSEEELQDLELEARAASNPSIRRSQSGDSIALDADLDEEGPEKASPILTANEWPRMRYVGRAIRRSTSERLLQRPTRTRKFSFKKAFSKPKM
ncbi:FLNA [Branchiostoma lanceolatum]|uniref:FLNA protein n=1 Tax=Branchiostoma lanceolatum TaxID=7740 RepID=A0A8J9Z0B2_BRALA|nr:FLNA [Branchiostoma lanceolatum]